MAAKTFYIKQGDQRPHLEANLNLYSVPDTLAEEQLDLSLATDVVFSMRNAAGDIIIDKAPAIIDDEDERLVHYEWEDGDTDEAGTFFGEFQVNFGSESETFPNNRIGFKIKITAQIA